MSMPDLYDLLRYLAAYFLFSTACCLILGNMIAANK